MRRIHLGIVAGIVAIAVALTGAAGAQALWGVDRALQAGVTTTGNFSVTASWLGGTPAWPSLFPGARTPDTKVRVTQAGNGTTLGWRIRVSSTVNPAFASDVTFQAWAGECGTGVLIPAGGYPSTGHLTQNTSVDVCVRYTLAALAPGTLQGKGLTPNITITGEQVGG